MIHLYTVKLQEHYNVDTGIHVHAGDTRKPPNPLFKHPLLFVKRAGGCKVDTVPLSQHTPVKEEEKR